MDEKLLEERKKIILDIIDSPNYVPMKIKELAILLNVPKENREDLAYVLNLLVSEGKIGVSKKGKYGKVSSNLKLGVFSGTKNGYGFVAIEGETEDVFIPASRVNGALHGDTVQIAVHPSSKPDKKSEGEVLRIVARGADTVVGLYKQYKTYGFVLPDNKKINKDIFIAPENSKSAMDGHKVVVKIIDYGNDDKNPEGKVLEIIGHINDPGTDIMSIVKAYGIPTEYPKDVMDEVEKIPSVVSASETKGRTDLRNVDMVTIDGEDAKDLDDAVSVSFDGTLFHLGVHIADVSNYVKEFSPLDKEALKRGTSVYLVDRVIPMLPHKLSNGICSLNEGVDRLALSCLMDIDLKGNIVGHSILETVINVNRRMSYTGVKKIIIDKDEDTIKEYESLVPMFNLMYELSKLLREKRRKRGAIDFDIPECKIVLDEKGSPVLVAPYERNDAHKIIEDFMLAANETVAEDLFWQEMPFLYRVHENPDPEKMQKLMTFINNFGYDLKGVDEIHPKEIQKLIDKIEGTPEEAIISRVTLRSMKKARYSVDCSGHFGLAAKYYCHFTSPIRRYPDLMIHRIIKENLNGGLSEKRINHYNNMLPEIADSTSLHERRADEAERETEKLKKVEFIIKHLDEEFEGVISGVSAFGIYVELPNTVEGFVKITDLDDDMYYFEEENYRLIGRNSHKTLSLGQKVRIVVLAADKLQRTVDFGLVMENEGENEVE